MKSAVSRGGTQNARAFEKEGPTGAAGFAGSSSSLLDESSSLDESSLLLSTAMGAGAGGATSSSDELSSLLLLSSSDELGSGGGGAGAFFFLPEVAFLATLLVVRFVGAIVHLVLLCCSAVCGRFGSAYARDLGFLGLAVLLGSAAILERF